MKNYTITITLMSVMILAGCSTSYRATLEQKLTGKSTEEKRIILAQECKNEINAGLKKDDPSNVRHFESMKQICQEMTGR